MHSLWTAYALRGPSGAASFTGSLAAGAYTSRELEKTTCGRVRAARQASKNSRCCRQFASRLATGSRLLDAAPEEPARSNTVDTPPSARANAVRASLLGS